MCDEKLFARIDIYHWDERDSSVKILFTWIYLLCSRSSNIDISGRNYINIHFWLVFLLCITSDDNTDCWDTFSQTALPGAMIDSHAYIKRAHTFLGISFPNANTDFFFVCLCTSQSVNGITCRHLFRTRVNKMNNTATTGIERVGFHMATSSSGNRLWHAHYAWAENKRIGARIRDRKYLNTWMGLCTFFWSKPVDWHICG